LAIEDAALAVQYAECKSGQAAAVKAYNDTRDALIKFKADHPNNVQ